MKKIMFLVVICAVLASCGGNSSAPADGSSAAGSSNTKSYDPERGEGKFTHVDISPSLDQTKVASGEKVFAVKCSACHKLTAEKLVGPGWKDVTHRHTAEWIMNFATNTDEMINKDPKVKALLEICLVRMPNQNVSDDDARNIYEFMRKNDGVQ